MSRATAVRDGSAVHPVTTRPGRAVPYPRTASVTDITVAGARRPRPVDGPCHADRAYRRLVVVVDRGVEGLLQVLAALRPFSDRLRDVAADVHEGVRIHEIVCTVAVTADELTDLTERLEREPAVIAAGAGDR